MSQLVIIAGGKGTRMSNKFAHLPKSLVPLMGQPLLAHQLNWAHRNGVTQVEIFAGYLGEQIADYVQSTTWPGMDIRVHIEQEPLGNAGAVLNHLSLMQDTFIVAYGDLMIDLDLSKLIAFHQSQNAQFTAVVHPNDHPYDSDLYECDPSGVVTQIHLYPHVDKGSLPNLVNAAMYAIERDVLAANFPAGQKSDFTKQIIPGLLKANIPVHTFRTVDYVKDVGTPDRLEKAERDIARGVVRLSSTSARRPAIFLDRDGTLNPDDGKVTSPECVQLLPGVAPALKRLRSEGYLLVVVTNQPMIAKGEATEQDLELVHRELEWQLGKERAFVDRIYYCPHHPDKGFAGERPELKIRCDCRKPEIGLFTRACAELEIDPDRSWMIGDRTVDIEFANRAGLKSVLLQTGDAGRDGKYTAQPQFVAADLTEAAELICSANQPAIAGNR